MTEFDKRDIYEKMIKDKVYELKLLCNRERIPMFFSACVENSKKGSTYESEIVGSCSNGIELKKDLIPKYINVYNGFDTVPHDEVLELEMDIIEK